MSRRLSCPLEPAATLTADIVQVALGDLPHGSLGYQTIFAAGLMLMLMTLFFNVAGHLPRKRFRENAGFRESAPLITVGTLTFIAFLPPSPFRGTFPFLSWEWARSSYTVLPIQLFNPDSPVGREDRDGKDGLFDEQKSAGRSRDYEQTFL